jgi:2-isopropylmalate synthase
MSTDLRDGNQALIEPMSVEKKLRMFKLLVNMGFKEIEVAFPSASETDFNFVRRLIEDDLIPDDVTIEVLSQAREHLIQRTVESLIGAKSAIIHLYNPIAPAFRKMVFGKSKEEIIEIATEGTRLLKAAVSQHPETRWTYEYSPETFSMAELEFSKEICDAVVDIWNPSTDNKIIINLPATVECSTPNVYADQIEWMHNNLKCRDEIILSIHPHNDRGTAVAAAELAMMAGADRVEGCLFGNGERTGNVDLITLAMNLYSQGIHPNLDLSDMNGIQNCMEECTRLPVHPRHPYCGELVFTAFSGSHQDAIKKGFAKQNSESIWEVPYLPIDPRDVGRNYDAVIRVNSQSGKGGVAYILEKNYGIEMPRKMQIELSQVVQAHTDKTGAEVTPEDILNIFNGEYVDRNRPYQYVSHTSREHVGAEDKVEIEVALEVDGKIQQFAGEGNGPLDAAVKALALDIDIFNFHEHSINAGSASEAICFVELRYQSDTMVFGVGRDTSIVTASLKSLVSGLNRLNAIYCIPLVAA